MGRVNLRLKILVLAAVLVSAVVALVAACGSDDGGGGGACEGAACDGGSSESSTTDGPGADTSMADGGAKADADADSSSAASCGDGGEPGTLDPTFGDGGLVWLKYPGSAGKAVVLQSDGKIVVGGYTATKLAVIRLLADGALDPTFGSAGLVEVTGGDFGNGIDAIAIQMDGRLVAAGGFNVTGSPRPIVVLRQLSDGGLDPGFGDGGMVLTSYAGRDAYAQGVVVQPDGRILVSGYSEASVNSNATQNYEVVRYNTNGSLDTTYGVGGKVTIDVRGTADQGGIAALGPSGRIIVGGTTGQNTSLLTPNDLSVVRLDQNGNVDTAFGDAGIAVERFGSAQGYPVVAPFFVDPAGKTIACGTFPNPGAGGDFGLVTLTSSGKLDSTFGDAGLVTTDFGVRQDGCARVLLQEDGKLVAVGQSDLGSSTTNIALARYLPTGALDQSFGASGLVLTSPPPNSDLGATAAVASPCALVTVGTWGYNNNSVPQTAIGIARYRR